MRTTSRWSPPTTSTTPRPRRRKSHDALLCIADGAFTGQEDRRRITGEHWFKTAAAMRALFADLPEACDTTMDIARRCAFLAPPGRRSCRASTPARAGPSPTNCCTRPARG
jgi:DNA polymerase III alpha subunit